MRLYKIRRFQNGKNKKGKPFINYSLTIPTEVAEKLPDDMRFSCELTDDGILFRPATEEESNVKLPSWADESPRPSPVPQKRRPRPGSTAKV